MQSIGRLTVYADRDVSNAGAHADVPLLLIHSVNATASAIEMAPVFERQASRRPLVALELPGFGSSARPAVQHTPGMMSNAIAAALAWTRSQVADVPVDVMALSLACEFAAETALTNPDDVRSLALISPTGMESRRAQERYEEGRTRENKWLRRLLRHPSIGPALYRLLTKRASMRWFLSRAWGTKDFDQRLLEYGRLCAGQPGAHHAPLDFVSGALFTRGIIERYRLLPMPVWVVHGQKGSFTDFKACPTHAGSVGNARPHRVTRTAFDTGSMPHCEWPEEFDAAYDRFLAGAVKSARLYTASPGRSVPGSSLRWVSPLYSNGR
ncbi:MAG TPA: alpha/beta hydrolase [Rubrivivax sp.]